MENKNLLAIINPGDENDHRIHSFLESLPKDTIRKFESFGYLGNLVKSYYERKKRNMKRFVIFNANTFDDINNDYFASTSGALIAEIPDKLRLRILYKRTEAFGGKQIMNMEGPITGVVGAYGALRTQDQQKFLESRLDKDENLRNWLVKMPFFGGGDGIIPPVCTTMGIETMDGKYLLSATSVNGPYHGKVKRDKLERWGML